MSKLLIITQKVDENDQLLGFFIDWIKLFAERFQAVTILCLEAGKFDLPPNVRILSLGKNKNRPKLFWLFNFYKYIFQKRKEYDTVFVHMNPIWVVVGGWFWRLAGKKILFWYTTKGVTLKLRVAEKFAHTILTASRESFRLPSKKVIITGHGIDTDLFKPSDKGQTAKVESLKILSVGRIAPVKNYETLIDAAKILADRGLKFSVTLIGEPALPEDMAYAQKLKNRINRLGLNRYFKFLGKVNYAQLPEYYQSHALFVHLSKTGSLDKVLLEAMACGLPVLSSNDSAKSILPPELIFAENNPGELAEKIQAAQNRGYGQILRAYVVKNHNLVKLIDKIAATI